jgi:hypothetical protein
LPVFFAFDVATQPHSHLLAADAVIFSQLGQNFLSLPAFDILSSTTWIAATPLGFF